MAGKSEVKSWPIEATCSNCRGTIGRRVRREKWRHSSSMSEFCDFTAVPVRDMTLADWIAFDNANESIVKCLACGFDACADTYNFCPACGTDMTYGR